MGSVLDRIQYFGVFSSPRRSSLVEGSVIVAAEVVSKEGS